MKKTLGIITTQWHFVDPLARLNGSLEMPDTMVFAKGGDSDLMSVARESRVDFGGARHVQA
jgi:hypothetical protein